MLFEELKRRNVIRVGAAYLIASWVLLQIADVLIGILELPGWTGKLLVTVLALGFPIALVFAWAFEITPEGIKAEADVDRSRQGASDTAKKLNMITIVMVVAALLIFVGDKIFFSDSRSPVSAASNAAMVTPEASVAVLPFANISQDVENEPFTNGIHDDLLTHISKIGTLRTISRLSVMRYKGSGKPVNEIAAELGVATILEGGVQRAGDRVRINVALIEAQSGAQIWTDSYDRELTATNIFVIQSEIVKSIAEALKATLSPDEKSSIEKIPTENLEALELYFKGKERNATRNTEALQQAIEFFERAIALDPDFALAYVGLSNSYQFQEDAGGLSRDEMFAKAEPALEKAFELDKDLGPAYNSYGGLKWSKGDFSGAEKMFEKSIELNPGYATAYLWYGELLNEMGRVDEAVVVYRTGIKHDPLSPVLHESLANVLEYQGRFDQALKNYRRAVELNPDFASTYFYVGNMYWMASGSIAQAIACHEQSIELDPGARLAQTWHGLLYLDLADLPQAEKWISQSLQLAESSQEPRAAMALLHFAKNDVKNTVRYAEEVVEIFPYYPDQKMFQSMMLALLRNEDLKNAEPNKSRARYQKNYPELFTDEFEVGLQNYRPAIDLAYQLQKTGDEDRASALLDKASTFIESGRIDRLGIGGFGIADVQIYALRGEQDRALSTLRRAIDRGWRGFWWFYLRDNPNLESLEGNVAFDSMVTEVEAFMLNQPVLNTGSDTCRI